MFNKKKNKILFSTNKDCTKNKILHAEIKLIEKGSKINGFNFKDCILITSLEPCLMCLSACSIVEIPKIIYCANCEKWGGLNFFKAEKIINKNKSIPLCEKYSLENSIFFEKKSLELIKTFFKEKRKKLKIDLLN